MSQYIGKTISLISSKGIRYVGILEDVNGEEATVTLKNVKSFGSEGRLGDPSREIPPSNDVYPVVVFRGSDVHDLSVLEDPVPTPTETKPTSTQPVSQPVPQQSESPIQNTTTESIPAPQPQRFPQQSQQRQQRQYHHQQSYRQAQFAKQELPNTDFNFEENNAKFEQLRTQDGITETPEGFSIDPIELEKQKQAQDDETPSYDKKKSFFDTISNSASDPPRRQGGSNFGNNDFGNNRGGFRRGRGRGRGGRGRGGFNETKPAWA